MGLEQTPSHSVILASPINPQLAWGNKGCHDVLVAGGKLVHDVRGTSLTINDCERDPKDKIRYLI